VIGMPIASDAREKNWFVMAALNTECKVCIV
jgi:hypothetical protein